MPPTHRISARSEPQLPEALVVCSVHMGTVRGVLHGEGSPGHTALLTRATRGCCPAYLRAFERADALTDREGHQQVVGGAPLREATKLEGHGLKQRRTPSRSDRLANGCVVAKGVIVGAHVHQRGRGGFEPAQPCRCGQRAQRGERVALHVSRGEYLVNI